MYRWGGKIFIDMAYRHRIKCAADLIPDLGWAVSALYEGPAVRIKFRLEDGTEYERVIDTGVLAGDPLSMILFAITFHHKVLGPLQSEFPDAPLGAFADDVAAVMLASRGAQFIARFIELLATIDGKLNLDKCLILSVSGSPAGAEAAATLAARCHMSASTERGAIICGVPVGTPEFCSAGARAIADRIIATHARITAALNAPGLLGMPRLVLSIPRVGVAIL